MAHPNPLSLIFEQSIGGVAGQPAGGVQSQPMRSVVAIQPRLISAKPQVAARIAQRRHRDESSRRWRGISGLPAATVVLSENAAISCRPNGSMGVIDEIVKHAGPRLFQRPLTFVETPPAFRRQTDAVLGVGANAIGFRQRTSGGQRKPGFGGTVGADPNATFDAHDDPAIIEFGKRQRSRIADLFRDGPMRESLRREDMQRSLGCGNDRTVRTGEQGHDARRDAVGGGVMRHRRRGDAKHPGVPGADPQCTQSVDVQVGWCGDGNTANRNA